MAVRRTVVSFLLLFNLVCTAYAATPELGATIIVDDSSVRNVDHLFSTLAKHEIPLTRMFLEDPTHERDDLAFRAAEKYKVKIVATLILPKIPSSRSHLQELEAEILDTVKRYKDSPALDTWALLNEPGLEPEMNELAQERFKDWAMKKYGTIETLNKAWGTQFTVIDDMKFRGTTIPGTEPNRTTDWYTFYAAHHTWYLNWIADVIKSVDNTHPFQVNPHRLIDNLSQYSYDFPSWRPFLSALGSTIHPGWTFYHFERRERYPLGIAYCCELLRGSFEPKPFWVTEMQGGNNLYSGNAPMLPTEADLAQWTWTAIGSGAERVIYWALNARHNAGEAGGWAILDYQDEPTERLETIASIADAINKNRKFFDAAKPIASNLTILLSLDTMNIQRYYHHEDFLARHRFAHVKAIRAMLEACLDLGLPVRIKHINDFNWEQEPNGQLLILPDVSAITTDDAAKLTAFAKRGNGVFATGMTGMYGPATEFWHRYEEFPLKELFGGRLNELRMFEPKFEMELSDPQVTLPVHLFMAEIENHGATVIGRKGDWITATHNKIGKGETVWVPALIELGSWLNDDTGLCALIDSISKPYVKGVPFRFEERTPSVVMRVMKNGNRYLTSITNGKRERASVNLIHPANLKPHAIWKRDSDFDRSGTTISLAPMDTLVLLWE